MRLFAGTSGFSYKGWKGPFYPEGLPQDEWLTFYSSKLSAVEINNTFYRMPKAQVMAQWAQRVGPEFAFVIKASQRITHRQRLRECADSVDYLWRALEPLGAHRGPLLFQLPPDFAADAERLRDFLAILPDACRATFEFRHESWATDEVHECLAARDVALCFADNEEGEEEEAPALVSCASWGYLRLRRSTYSDAELASWVARIRAQAWKEVFVFFKHEDEGEAPRLALRFEAAFERAGDTS